MPKRITRRTVPVDGQPHTIPVGSVATVTNADAGFGMVSAVDVWVEVVDGALDRKVQVVATDEPIPLTWSWLASLVDARATWHLYGVPA